jgi:hypothetical protein
MFGLGILTGIVVIVGLLRLTMREEPTGCVVIFGSFFFLLLASIIFNLW